MRIGIDGSCWSNRRGFGRFTRCLVEELAQRFPDDEWLLLLDRVSADDPDLPALPAGVDVRTVAVDRAPSRAASADGSRSLRDVARMSLAGRSAQCDAFFFPASYSWFPVPGTPTVVTVHDAIAERHSELVFPSRAHQLRWKLKEGLAVRCAAMLLTVSQASRAAVTETLRVSPDRLRVIREAPAAGFRHVPEEERAASLGRLDVDPDVPYFLYVGGISPHKNLLVLVEAFSAVASRHSEVRLLLAGDAEDDPFLSSAGSVRAALAASAARDRISLLGFVADDDLAALYSGAVATALPSIDEGFGLTAAESAACGTPVVASRRPALVGLLGPAGVYADPSSADDFAAALERLLSDEGARRSAAGACADLAATWSWADAAATTREVLGAVAARG